MSRYLLRLDDACEHWNRKSWLRMEALLLKYGVNPLIGVIPKCEDESLMVFGEDPEYSDVLSRWASLGWELAMHGCNHRYETNLGGINPVQKRSEFAGVPYEMQLCKMTEGYERLVARGLKPRVFFAPSHTFDLNTVKALVAGTPIRIISDTFSYSSYRKDGVTFVPLHAGHPTKMPFKVVCFCLHPNTMSERAFCEFEAFLESNSASFVDFDSLISNVSTRTENILDRILKKLYFLSRKVRGL